MPKLAVGAGHVLVSAALSSTRVHATPARVFEVRVRVEGRAAVHGGACCQQMKEAGKAGCTTC